MDAKRLKSLVNINFKTTKYYIEYSGNVMIHVFQPELYLEKGQ